MVNNGVKTYDVVGFCNITYDIVGKTYDVVCTGVGNIVGTIGNLWVKTYDVVGYYTILYTTAYTMS